MLHCSVFLWREERLFDILPNNAINGPQFYECNLAQIHEIFVLCKSRFNRFAAAEANVN